jgi:hypothetical protein
VAEMYEARKITRQRATTIKKAELEVTLWNS